VCIDIDAHRRPVLFLVREEPRCKGDPVADFAAAVLAKALVTFLESFVTRLIQAAFAAAFGRAEETVAACA